MPPRSLKSIIGFGRVSGLRPRARPVAAHHLRQLFRRPCRKARQRLSRAARIVLVSRHVPQCADRALQELGNRDRTYRTRLPAGDIGRRHADRSRRRYHHHRRSAQAGRRFVGDQALRGQSMVHEHAAVPPRRQAHRRDRHRHAARPHGRSDRLSVEPVRRMGRPQPSRDRRIRRDHPALGRTHTSSAKSARRCRPSASRCMFWKR